MSFVVGLTGGIGSGKTVASDHFGALGVPIIDTDIIAREIVEPDSPTLADLAEKFGDQILNPNGSLNRGALRDLAFSSSKNKATLDAITHPAIRKKTFERIAEVTHPYCIVVVPLLTADSPFAALMDRTLAVTAERQTKIVRVMQRSQLSRDEVEKIMATQLGDQERLAFCDDVIANDGSIEDVQMEVVSLHSTYLTLSAEQTL